MFDLSDPKTYWLNITNIGLGLVVLACCVAVVRAFVIDLLERRSQRTAAGTDSDGHTFFEPELGITMADGGEKRDEKTR